MSSWTVPGYTEITELGRGAVGVVRLATHDATGQYVAIKHLSDELLADQEFRAGFRSEARLLGEIDSPNVARLYEYVESADGAAIVMELVDGVSLRAMLNQHGPTEPEAALYVLKGSLLGLGAAHRRSIVHRDYKPENVLVDVDGASKLTDFGVAAPAGGDAVGGTPLYMAPEQWRGEPPSPSGDIYAATATFVECLTGRPPFEAPDLDLLRKQHERAPAPVDELPEPVRGLARRGLAKQPQDRPADAPAFLAELESAAVAGYGEDWEERGRASLGRRAAMLAVLFPLLAAGLAGGTAIAMTRLGGQPGPPPAPPAAPPAGRRSGGRPAGGLRRQRAPIAAAVAAGLVLGGATLALQPSQPRESVQIGPSSSVGGSNPVPELRPMPPGPGPAAEPREVAPPPGPVQSPPAAGVPWKAPSSDPEEKQEEGQEPARSEKPPSKSDSNPDPPKAADQEPLPPQSSIRPKSVGGGSGPNRAKSSGAGANGDQGGKGGTEGGDQAGNSGTDGGDKAGNSGTDSGDQGGKGGTDTGDKAGNGGTDAGPKEKPKQEAEDPQPNEGASDSGLEFGGYTGGDSKGKDPVVN